MIDGLMKGFFLVLDSGVVDIHKSIGRAGEQYRGMRRVKLKLDLVRQRPSNTNGLKYLSDIVTVAFNILPHSLPQIPCIPNIVRLARIVELHEFYHIETVAW